MIRFRYSTLWLIGALVVLFGVLLALRGALQQAHLDETIEYVASDAATYYELYHDLYEGVDLGESLGLFLIGSPILFMKLAEGNLFWIQLADLALMGVTLRVALDCFATRRGRLLFVAGALVFPYFLFGFLSLNKEVYAMCSAIFFASYLVRGLRAHLVAALLLAACARYYMLAALVSLLFLVPRKGEPRLGWAVALLVALSLLAPVATSSVSGYSAEGVLEVSGVLGKLFSEAVDAYGYAIVYPIKYVALIPNRLYSFLLGAERMADTMEAVVSVVSLVAFVFGCRLLLTARPVRLLVRKLVLAALLAPIPIMWSEIMHWRYYSFVYFFFLFAIVLHGEAVHSRRVPAAVHA